MMRVLVAGAGVAAVECVLALRDLAGSRASIELMAPAAELVHRASSVTTPFGGAPAARIDLRRLATELGIKLRRDSLASVDTRSHHVLTRDDDRVAYDLLVVATGARSQEAVPGAVTFRGPMHAGLVEQAVARVAAQPDLRLAFAAPPGVRWLLPLYELAMLSAAACTTGGSPSPTLWSRQASTSRSRCSARQRARPSAARSTAPAFNWSRAQQPHRRSKARSGW